MNRKIVWSLFLGALALTLGLKAVQLGWLYPKPPLELNGQPTVLVFIRFDGACECVRFVNDNALAQVTNWPPASRGGIPLLIIDIERRSDLAKKFKVIRASSMLLLDANGEIVWRQDEVISDELPLNLPAVEAQTVVLLAAEEMRTL